MVITWSYNGYNMDNGYNRELHGYNIKLFSHRGWESSTIPVLSCHYTFLSADVCVWQARQVCSIWQQLGHRSHPYHSEVVVSFQAV